LSLASATQAAQLAQSTVGSFRPGDNNLDANLIVETQDFRAGIPGSFLSFDPIEPINGIVFPTIPAP
jgi:hypothetical protein